MRTREALAAWLGGLGAGQLTELLEQRGLPGAAVGGAGVGSTRVLADLLLTDGSVGRALRAANTADVQVLTAIGALAERTFGPVPAPGRGGSSDWGGFADPAERAVPRAALEEFLRLDAAAARALGAVLARLAESALLLPHPQGLLVAPQLIYRQTPELLGLGGPVDAALSTVFQAGEITRIHRALGLPAESTRDARQRAIVAALSDTGTVRALADQAPPAARAVLDRLVAGPAAVRTRCFVSRYGGYYTSAPTTYVLRPGSGDPGADWLAEHGLLVPAGEELAELPYEAGTALRDPDARPPYDPVPPQPRHTAAVQREAVDHEARAAAFGAAARIELLMRQVAVQPLAVRRSGGIAVRDTRRLAKALGATEQQTRLWLDLASCADLLAPLHPEPEPVRGRRSRHAPPPPPPRMLPSGRFPRWLAAAPAERLLPLVATWAVVPEVFSHWPDPESTPVALVDPEDPAAVPLRRALLEALAELTPGQGVCTDRPDALEDLLAVAAWRLPALVGRRPRDPERLAATLAEAELLGVVAHGVLTPIGHAVLGLLRAGADRHFPAVPGAGPSLKGRPELAAAVAALAAALAELLPAPRTTARFQADLTVVVSGSAAPELTDLLASCADRESEGHAVVWRISAASMRRALDSGSDPEELLARLGEVSEGGRGLPQPLEYLVKDTARTHGRMRVVRSGCCVRSDDESLLLELSRTRALARLGLRRIAPTVLISAADPDTTLAALRRAGFAPVLEAETGGTVIERVEQEHAPARMPSLDAAHPAYGRGPRTARALAAALLGTGEPE
ncbi:helicase-associated domain-containing protein [Streptacidiphilus cavernicola]|uniref:Helicase-associated domain-containing protein n=1 Tax=Streptacidiphilus cavernicola TaxID=3342716 RepID=A0ABV6VUE1_9ACTN